MKFKILLIVLVWLASTGCQTFSLTEEEFARQQHGEMADPETGAVVGVAGTLGYYGALIGALVSGIK